MAVNFTLFNAAVGAIGRNDIDLDTHTFKAVLSNTAPNLTTNTQLSNITQISNGNGYTTGGVTLTSVTFAVVTGSTYRFDSADFEWAASGGSIGPFRYVILYSDTSTNDLLLGQYDFGSAITIPDGSFFRVEVGANGHMQTGIGTIT